MSQRVLCVGATPAVQRTMRFERLTRGGVNRAKSVSVTPAGKGVNVAVSLRLLGVEPVLTGFLGGPTGELMKTMLAERGVTVDCAAAAAPTRVCTTILEGHPPKAATELVEEAATPDDEDWRALFAKYRALHDSAEYATLSPARRRILDNEVRDFRLSGAELPEEQKPRFKEIQEELASLSTKFSENVLDATNAFAEYVSDPALLAGLPDDSVEAARLKTAAFANTYLSGILADLERTATAHRR